MKIIYSALLLFCCSFFFVFSSFCMFNQKITSKLYKKLFPKRVLLDSLERVLLDSLEEKYDLTYQEYKNLQKELFELRNNSNRFNAYFISCKDMVDLVEKQGSLTSKKQELSLIRKKLEGECSISKELNKLIKSNISSALSNME